MGVHAKESNSLPGKSLPLVNELSLGLGAKFFLSQLQSCFNAFIFCELRLKRSHFLSLLVFSHEKQWLPSVFIPCVCDGCALSFNSNPTWLSFSSDDIRVYLKGLGLVVCTSDFLAKPPNPRDGVRRITVSTSLVGG